jgi:arylsulfatase A-like enzyme
MPMPRRSYARVVSSVDNHIGQIIDKLEATGLRHNTIVILMSDNGHSVEDSSGILVDDHSSGYPRGHYYLAHGGGGNTGKWIGHKGTFLEGGIRVPAIISFPAKIPQNQTRDQVVTIMDWFPTVLELCNVKRPASDPKLDGSSLVELFDDASSDSPHKVLHFAWGKNWAVRRGDWKLICKYDSTSVKEVLSLHNLSGPEPEVKEHSLEQPELVQELKALHEAWQQDVNVK